MKLPFRLTPAHAVLLGFAGIILLGTLLLMLPFASPGPGGASFLTALFTATSSTCVTGLVAVDTATGWSLFGQAIILLLIQIGGMGVVTVAVALNQIAGRKIGLSSRFFLQESMGAPQLGGIVRMLRFILRTMLAMEGIGACLFAIRFIPDYGLLRGTWYSIFHAISAFCNAGFDLMGHWQPYSSMTRYADDPLVLGTVMALIVLGGIGFFVWDDIAKNQWHFRNYTLQTKVVLTTTALLLILPFLWFWLCEFVHWNGMSTGKQALSALFQTVCPRTAGFNNVDLNQLSGGSKLLTILLMLVGGSPSSTAGGIKTTTLAILLLALRAAFTTDLHSMGQFIQDGSRNLFETVIDFITPAADLTVEEDPENLDGLNFLSGMAMRQINRRAMQGTILAHTRGGVPNLVLEVPAINEEEYGYMVYFFMLACGVSGYLLGVNPFDQPGVEAYKKNMFALLGKPGYEALRQELLAKLGE